jgi:transposase
VPDRAALTGIIFVLKSGIPGEMLPQELGCGSGVTCWRRLRDWQEAGVWARLHHELLDRLGEADQIDWRRASLDSASIAAQREARPSARIPRIAAKRAGSARWGGDRRGLPLASLLTGANRHDSVVFEALLDAIPPLKTPAGRRRRRPDKVQADQASAIPRCRQALRRRHIRVRIARKGIDSSARLGRHRWVIERTLSWLNRFRRLTVRYERRADIHQAFPTLGCALICFNALQKGF